MIPRTLTGLDLETSLRCEGMGRLDCGRDVSGGQRVAVRWLPGTLGAAQAARKAVAALPAHPGLPAVVRSGVKGQASFVATEFPQGRLLSAGPWQGDAVALARAGAQVASTLAALHGIGVVHGELSPHSVLCREAGDLMLWDVPLVVINRLTDRRREATLLSKLPRLAAFLAPERAAGGEATPAGDVFALGALLCHLVEPGAAGRPTLQLVQELGRPGWRPAVPSLPEPLASVVASMVDPSPQRRPGARDVERALTALAGEPWSAAQPPTVDVELPEDTSELVVVEATTAEIDVDDVSVCLLRVPTVELQQVRSADAAPTLELAAPATTAIIAPFAAARRRPATPWVLLTVALAMAGAALTVVLVERTGESVLVVRPGAAAVVHEDDLLVPLRR